MADNSNHKVGGNAEALRWLTPAERAQVLALAEEMLREYWLARIAGHPLIRFPAVD